MKYAQWNLCIYFKKALHKQQSMYGFHEFFTGLYKSIWNYAVKIARSALEIVDMDFFLLICAIF